MHGPTTVWSADSPPNQPHAGCRVAEDLVAVAAAGVQAGRRGAGETSRRHPVSRYMK